MTIEYSFDDVTRKYWNSIAENYRVAINILTNEFHYGPLVPPDSQLKLLPEKVTNLRCLELGCGIAQNSVYLAKQGAECVAIDISEEQIANARKLAQKENVKIELASFSMEDASCKKLGLFDIVHSSYAISFTQHPGQVIKNCAEMLSTGGILLFSTGHPLFAGEWIDLDGESGLFLQNYFKPEPDSRFDDEGRELVRSSLFPVSVMADWILDAGLKIERILEPEPMPIDKMSEQEISRKVPYASKGWLELYEQLKNVPALIIFKCSKS